MELSPSWETANCAATIELPSILWNPNVHYRVHKSPPLVPILSQIGQIPTIPAYLRSILILSTHLHLGLPSGLFPSGFPTNTRTVNTDIKKIKAISFQHLPALIIAKQERGSAFWFQNFEILSHNFGIAPITSEFIINNNINDISISTKKVVGGHRDMVGIKRQGSCKKSLETTGSHGEQFIASAGRPLGRPRRRWVDNIKMDLR
jgi:hypothetical protein